MCTRPLVGTAPAAPAPSADHPRGDIEEQGGECEGYIACYLPASTYFDCPGRPVPVSAPLCMMPSRTLISRCSLVRGRTPALTNLIHRLIRASPLPRSSRSWPFFSFPTFSLRSQPLWRLSSPCRAHCVYRPWPGSPAIVHFCAPACGISRVETYRKLLFHTPQTPNLYVAIRTEGPQGYPGGPVIQGTRGGSLPRARYPLPRRVPCVVRKGL
jgi:hypothetical protein